VTEEIKVNTIADHPSEDALSFVAFSCTPGVKRIINFDIDNGDREFETRTAGN